MSKQETQTEQPGTGAQTEESIEKTAASQNESGDACRPENQDKGTETPSSPEQKVAELETQLAESRDQLLRKAAEFENFRKRMNQEKQNAIEYANQSLLQDIIPIIDDFERAIAAGEGSTDYTGLLEGIKMIEKRFTSQLEAKWGLKRFSAAGNPFDPNLHEAVMMEKSPDISEAVVKEDFSRGYMLKDRVIRAAQVKVLMPEA